MVGACLVLRLRCWHILLFANCTLSALRTHTVHPHGFTGSLSCAEHTSGMALQLCASYLFLSVPPNCLCLIVRDSCVSHRVVVLAGIHLFNATCPRIAGGFERLPSSEERRVGIAGVDGWCLPRSSFALLAHFVICELHAFCAAHTYCPPTRVHWFTELC